MNIIHKLYDEEFIKKFFDEKILPLYPCFKSIKKINIHGIKNHIWEVTYHVVIGYDTFFVDEKGETTRLQIYCSAHSEEERKNVFEALSFLWSKGFAHDQLTIPHALCYSEEFKGIFYRGIKGKNFYRYIKNEEINEIKILAKLSAQWFAKLHSLDTAGAKNFSVANSRIETIVPGAKHWLDSIRYKQPEYFTLVRNIFNIINDAEKKFLDSTDQRWLIHGDAHPENVIKISDTQLGVIDFTDMCLADFARDLGAFSQQVEYMAVRHIKNKKIINSLKKIFIDEYIKAANIKLDNEVKKRIKNYYNWAALRTVVFFLVKQHPEPLRAEELLNQLKKEMNL
ncbi:MAG: aminoglycoside phosphotransferase family protein [bacterium]|nr:aminoglycoside phosphotransferase family protein [bacterium]